MKSVNIPFQRTMLASILGVWLATTVPVPVVGVIITMPLSIAMTMLLMAVVWIQTHPIAYLPIFTLNGFALSCIICGMIPLTTPTIVTIGYLLALVIGSFKPVIAPTKRKQRILTGMHTVGFISIYLSACMVWQHAILDITVLACFIYAANQYRYVAFLNPYNVEEHARASSFYTHKWLPHIAR